jgi:hypothetical protein
MCSGPLLENGVSSIKYSTPEFQYEGVAGYIATEYEIEIKDLVVFSNIWNSWYSLSDRRRQDLYGMAKGLGDCK